MGIYTRDMANISKTKEEEPSDKNKKKDTKDQKDPNDKKLPPPPPPFDDKKKAEKPIELGSKTGYKFKNGQDVDFRGTGKTSTDALNEAFKKTETPKSEFEVTKWRKDANGKTFPVEWRAKNGAEVNIDSGHTTNGPDVPHIGYQTGGKRGSGGAERGHILVDHVPVSR